MGSKLTSEPYVCTMEHNIRNDTSNDIALVAAVLPGTGSLICLLHSLSLISLVTKVLSFPSTVATASINSKLFKT